MSFTRKKRVLNYDYLVLIDKITIVLYLIENDPLDQFSRILNFSIFLKINSTKPLYAKHRVHTSDVMIKNNHK
jgi:hypothetical protein